MFEQHRKNIKTIKHTQINAMYQTKTKNGKGTLIPGSTEKRENAKNSNFPVIPLSAPMMKVVRYIYLIKNSRTT